MGSSFARNSLLVAVSQSVLLLTQFHELVSLFQVVELIPRLGRLAYFFLLFFGKQLEQFWTRWIFSTIVCQVVVVDCQIKFINLAEKLDEGVPHIFGTVRESFATREYFPLDFQGDRIYRTKSRFIKSGLLHQLFQRLYVVVFVPSPVLSVNGTKAFLLGVQAGFGVFSPEDVVGNSFQFRFSWWVSNELGLSQIGVEELDSLFVGGEREVQLEAIGHVLSPEPVATYVVCGLA